MAAEWTWQDAHVTATPPRRPSRFETTHWSLVIAAGGDASSSSALAILCDTYWYPLYAYVRRQGYDPAPAQDLTQAFFLHVLQHRDLRRVRREKGRFRSWLLASFRHFLLNEAKHRRALKRGGRRITLSLDFERAEGRLQYEPRDTDTPERIFDREWALTVLRQVLTTLERDWAHAGKGAVFEKLKACLTGDAERGAYEQLGQDLGMSEGAVKVAVHRLRRDFRRTLREEIGNTVDSEAAVDGEIAYLFRVLKS